jgi:hypothetical protein
MHQRQARKIDIKTDPQPILFFSSHKYNINILPAKNLYIKKENQSEASIAILFGRNLIKDAKRRFLLVIAGISFSFALC